MAQIANTIVFFRRVLSRKSFIRSYKFFGLCVSGMGIESLHSGFVG